MKYNQVVFAIFIAILSNTIEALGQSTLYQRVEPIKSGITFENQVSQSSHLEYFKSMFVYLGSGIGIGDFNGDGLSDVIFGSTHANPRMFQNLGGLKFKDVTKNSGIPDSIDWVSGIGVVDINADGHDDIYLCRWNKQNKLFISNGDGTFSEKSKEWGLDLTSASASCCFFDADNDGDLDVYIATYGKSRSYGVSVKDVAGMSDYYLINNGQGHFEEKTYESWLQDAGYTFTVVPSDLNSDGFVDLYVTNDFEQPDVVYLNDKKGLFYPLSKGKLRHTPQFAMGCDVSDINNDGLYDIFSVDMQSFEHFRRNTRTPSTGAQSRFGPFFDIDQHGRNTLQLNRGNASFSDIGFLSGLYATEWSWATLIYDVDNDGLKDVFVANGFGDDFGYLDRAYNVLRLDTATYRRIGLRVEDFIFKNNGDLTFTHINDKWGVSEDQMTYSAVYADLDNDGDLDLITSPLDTVVNVYQNMTRESTPNSNYLVVKLVGDRANTHSLGAKVQIVAGGKKQFLEVNPYKGYLGSVSVDSHFGIGSSTIVDSVVVTWLGGKRKVVESVRANQILEIKEVDAELAQIDESALLNTPTLLKPIPPDSSVVFEQKEKFFHDFKSERLIPNRMSWNGPGNAVGDIDGDGLEDLIIGGSRDYTAAVYTQSRSGIFSRNSLAESGLLADSASEDQGLVLFDADLDGDLDLYVTSGGLEYPIDDKNLKHRFYLNNGKGLFTKASLNIPLIRTSSSCVVAADYDNDGDMDLFVAGRVVPDRYPYPPRSFVLENVGGKFTDVTKTKAPCLLNPGLVTSAVWSDFDSDGFVDLVVTGEWMSTQFIKNQSGKSFINITASSGIDSNGGWWNSISSGDYDNDGDIDYVVGNWGTNFRYGSSTKSQPIETYTYDFDDNGSLDPLGSYYWKGVKYPVKSRDIMFSQIPTLNRRFNTYSQYAKTTFDEMFPPGPERDTGNYVSAWNFKTSIIENMGQGRFALHALPIEVQFSPTLGSYFVDLNEDGYLDLVLVGNFYGGPEDDALKYDASFGEVLLGNGKGDFKSMPIESSGLFANQDARGLTVVPSPRNDKSLRFIVMNNQGTVQTFERTFQNSKTKILKIPPKEMLTKAVLMFRDGAQRIQEFQCGSGYLSQCAPLVVVTEGVKEVQFFRGKKLIRKQQF